MPPTPPTIELPKQSSSSKLFDYVAPNFQINSGAITPRDVTRLRGIRCDYTRHVWVFEDTNMPISPDATKCRCDGTRDERLPELEPSDKPSNKSDGSSKDDSKTDGKSGNGERHDVQSFRINWPTPKLNQPTEAPKIVATNDITMLFGKAAIWNNISTGNLNPVSYVVPAATAPTMQKFWIGRNEFRCIGSSAKSGKGVVNITPGETLVSTDEPTVLHLPPTDTFFKLKKDVIALVDYDGVVAKVTVVFDLSFSGDSVQAIVGRNSLPPVIAGTEIIVAPTAADLQRVVQSDKIARRKVHKLLEGRAQIAEVPIASAIERYDLLKKLFFSRLPEDKKKMWAILKTAACLHTATMGHGVYTIQK